MLLKTQVKSEYLSYVVSKVDAEPLLTVGPHAFDLQLLEEVTVKDFNGSKRRAKLFKSLESLVSELDNEAASCELWIDGSFLTKKAEPEDIDLTIVIDEAELNSLSVYLQNVIIAVACGGHPLGKELDCFIIRAADQKARAYWDDFWSSGRDNTPKGYAVVKLGNP